jgi:hypothetical protein
MGTIFNDDFRDFIQAVETVDTSWREILQKAG